jgi:cytochrome c biogenesis protein
MGVLGWLRWTWRQLTSMRTALVLLFLLAVAAIPGSLFPQRNLAPVEVREYIAANPTVGPILDRLGMFEVFGAPWFAAVYLLLFVSLAGCVIPRAWHHAQAMRARPPRAPRRFERLPLSRRATTDDAPDVVLERAAAALRKQRFRVDVDTDDRSVSAERGYLRETGNLVFHLSLLVLLCAVAIGSLFGFRGNVLVREETGFANVLTRYDSFNPGRLFDAKELTPLSFTLTDFEATFEEEGPQRGAPRSFVAEVEVLDDPDAEPRQATIRSNKPLNVDGTKVFLVGHGYAPEFTVRDGEGDVVFQDSVPFLPQDGNFTSTGVVKVPDALPEQLGFQAIFLPTSFVDPTFGPISTFPAPENPSVFMSAWTGDLGLNSGVAQSIYKLDSTELDRLGLRTLLPGETWELPDGAGSITFDGYQRFATFAVARDPGKGLALGSVIVMIVGLMLSLGIRRRRVWVRAVPGDDGRTVVTVGGLGRTEGAPVEEDVDRLLTALGLESAERSSDSDSDDSSDPDDQLDPTGSTEGVPR